ncbi:hypothetical protein [Reichenbachiella sp.]|uniref:hypothetical protein n=1 Tax=Reichenbachiella sp. TaxID=2184521 RepID=UPI003BAE7926
MTSDELDELKAEITGMDQFKKIALIGIVPASIMPVLVYFYKPEEFVISLICLVCVTIYFGYTAYWKPLSKLKKDINLRVSDSITAEVTKIKGADKNIIVRTKPKFELTYYDLDRFNIPVEQLNTTTKLQLTYARYSKHLFNLSVE